MKSKKIFIILSFLFIITISFFSVTLKEVKDNIEECTIYQAQEDTKLNFYLYVPFDKNKKPYIKLITNLVTITGFIKYDSIIALSDNKIKVTIDTSKETHSEQVMGGGGGPYGYGGTSAMYFEKVTLNLTDDQINEFIALFKDANKIELRFIGKRNVDDKINPIEINYIKLIFEKWLEITKK